MAIVLARIDDRLIHGQVVTSWMRALAPQVIVVADSRIPEDPIQVQILKGAAPPGVKVYVMTPEKISEKLLAGILDSYRVMLLFTGLEAPWKLLEQGVVIPSLNLGGMRFQAGRRQLSKAVCMTPEEMVLARRIIGSGVELEHRQLFDDKKQDVGTML